MAQRRHLPDRRRPRRRAHRHTALRAAQQLARQRQSRQGADAALAGQAEVRPEDFLGRPHDPGRQLRPGVDGVQDLRVRRRARGYLGAGGGHLLGLRDRVARRRALYRRPGTRGASRCGPDGSHLRQSGRAERQSRPGRLRPGYSRDLRAHGNERRGDRRARRRRTHLRQGPRRRRYGPCRPRARGRAHRATGTRLEEQLRQRQGGRCDHQRHRGCMDPHAGQVGQQLLRHPIWLRMGGGEEPRRRVAMGAEGRRRRGHRAGCPRSVETPCADDDHGGHGHADGPGLRVDLAAFPREPGRVRGCLRPGVVQADAPRHGSARALSRPRGSGRGADLAGPRPRRRP